MFTPADAQQMAMETITEISDNPRALFEKKQTLIEGIEQRLSVNLDSLIEQAIAIQSMHKAQAYDAMTFNAHDLHSISDFVIKQVQQQTLNQHDEVFLSSEIEELHQEIEYANDEIARIHREIAHLQALKVQNAIHCAQQIDQLRTFLAHYSKLAQ